MAFIEPVTNRGPVLISTVPNSVCTSLDASPNMFEPDENIIDDVWSLSVNFTIRQLGVSGVASIVTLGSFHYSKNNATVEGFAFNTVNNTTFDTTVNNTLDVTVEWGSVSASNSIYSDIFVLNKIY